MFADGDTQSTTVTLHPLPHLMMKSILRGAGSAAIAELWEGSWKWRTGEGGVYLGGVCICLTLKCYSLVRFLNCGNI